MKYFLPDNSFGTLFIFKKDLLKAPKIKRTHVYAMSPTVYEICCPICGKSNITWSEYEKHIWCFDCNKDIYTIHRFSGVFGSPIPIECAKILGFSFDRINIKTQEIIPFEDSDKFNSTFVQDENLIKYCRNIYKKSKKSISGKLKRKYDKN